MKITKRGGIVFWAIPALAIGGSFHARHEIDEVLGQHATDSLTLMVGVWSTLIVGWLA